MSVHRNTQKQATNVTSCGVFRVLMATLKEGKTVKIILIVFFL